MKEITSTSIKAIYRKADDYPVVVTISSLADICNLLGYVNLKVTNIHENILVISRDSAYKDGEPICLTDSVEEDGVVCTKSIYGDVVVVAYDPELEEVISLTQDQISSWLFTPEDLE